MTEIETENPIITPTRGARVRRHLTAAARTHWARAAVAVTVVAAVGIGGYAWGSRDGFAWGAGTQLEASNATGTPRLVASDGTCGSRLQLQAGGRVYAVYLDGEQAFRLTDITADQPGSGCTLSRRLPGGARTEDATGAQSARIRSGWDTQLNRCSQYTIIDGRRWVLNDPQVPGNLAHGGGGRILAGDPRCGGELPMQPYGGADCPDRGPGWRYEWDAVRGECVANAPSENRGEPQGR